MTDAEYEVQQARLLALADKWVKPLGLGWWDLDFAYARDDYEPPDSLSPKERDRSLAYCNVDWRYGHATITWNMPRVAEQTDEKLERAFVHELAHIFLNEMRWARDGDADHLDHEERVATTLTKAILWLRDSLLEQGKFSLLPDLSPSTEVSELRRLRDKILDARALFWEHDLSVFVTLAEATLSESAEAPE